MADETVEISNEFRISIILSMVRALWGEVPAYLRVVSIHPLGDKAFSINFYLDGDRHEEFFESASDVEGEVIGDFPEDFDISHNLIRRDAPERIFVGEGDILIFRRMEGW